MRTTGLIFPFLLRGARQQHAALFSSTSSLPSLIQQPPSDSYIINATKIWIQKVVFGLRLCPWSGSVLGENSTKMRVVVLDNDVEKWGDAVEMISLTNTILEEARLLSVPEAEGKTTLLVLPSFASSFETYLELVDVCESLLAEEALSDDVQVASFHPLYVFGDCEEESGEGEDEVAAENYTNRSPFPIVHLLRVEDVRSAIESSPTPTEEIWKKNIRVFKSMGTNKAKRLLQSVLEEAAEGNKQAN